MSEKKRTLMTSTQKAKVALEAVKGSKTVNEIAQEHKRPSDTSGAMEEGFIGKCQPTV